MNAMWSRLFTLNFRAMDQDDLIPKTNSPATDDDLANRLERLEQAHRRWRTLTLGLGLGVMALLADLVWTRHRSSDVLEARELIVRDDQGVIRARLSVDGDDGAQLVLHDEQEHPQLRLQGRADRSSYLEMLNPSTGDCRLILGAGSDGVAGLHLYDQHHLAATLRTDHQGSADLLFTPHRFGAAHSFAAASARTVDSTEPPARLALNWKPRANPDAAGSQPEASSPEFSQSPFVIDDALEEGDWAETVLE